MDGIDALADRADVTWRTETIEVDAEAFASIRETADAGVERYVGAVVRDDRGRVALVRTHWSDSWVVPGGRVEPGESLREAVVREETDIDASVERPLEVTEREHRHGDESVVGHFVVYTVTADDPTFGDDLGEDAVEIADAAWVEEVSEACENADLLERHC
jgi:ADP-ribose pyrophosphatase YjhB (NUDIX family)